MSHVDLSHVGNILSHVSIGLVSILRKCRVALSDLRIRSPNYLWSLFV